MPDVHDLGGKRDQFAPIEHASSEPPFHAIVAPDMPPLYAMWRERATA